MFGAKRLARKMIGGVDTVKLVLYTILVQDLSIKYKIQGEIFYKQLSAAIVNEIFSCHNELSQQNFDKHSDVAIQEIKLLGKNHPKLKQPITDALRIYFTIGHMLSPKKDGNAIQAMDAMHKAQEYGVSIKAGDAPKPSSFLSMTTELGLKYSVLKK